MVGWRRIFRAPGARLLIGVAVVLVACSLAGAEENASQSPAGQNSSITAARIASEAEEAMRRGDFDSAIGGFKKLIEMQPAVAVLYANLGIAYYFQGEFQQAVPPLEKALSLKPSLGNVECFLGISQSELGRYPEAIPHLERSLKKPSDRELERLASLHLERSYFAVQDFDKGVRVLQKLWNSYPNDPDVLYTISRSYSDLSTEALMQLLTKAPESFRVAQATAEALELKGDYARSLDYYRRVLAARPGLPGIHYRMGRMILLAQHGPGAFEKALLEFQEEARIDPSNANCEYMIGIVAQRQERPEAALSHFRRATELDPDFVQAQIAVGRILVGQNQLDAALKPFLRAVEIEPANEAAHFQLATLYRRLNRSQDAARELALYQKLHEQGSQEASRIFDALRGQPLPEPAGPENGKP